MKVDGNGALSRCLIGGRQSQLVVWRPVGGGVDTGERFHFVDSRLLNPSEANVASLELLLSVWSEIGVVKTLCNETLN